jgi:hypothetical protein
MIITKTITKKILENLVYESFLKLGTFFSSTLLDSLKLIGFQYATNSGISINIEDLKTPYIKTELINLTSSKIELTNSKWQQGFFSDTERFQTIIDNWNNASDFLKDQIVYYYQNYDPANKLYIMAFSGARGNISQVKQLVGMRGLMADQEGTIIDLPIQSNFREGLSSIDYIISSYGARKGIVDTALKTADSGYLTRRLIYVAQDIIIREKNCNTKTGITFFLNKTNNKKNLLGRTLLKTFNNLEEINKYYNYKNKIITKFLLNNLEKNNITAIQFGSILTCSSLGSVCQSCYGFDLASQKLINLGEAVGIIAAQSIGEPGTQLTMRTFHTGGVFTSEIVQQQIAKFSGKLNFPSNLKSFFYRTQQGFNVIKLQTENQFELSNWKGKKQKIYLETGSYLYLKKYNFYKKGEIIAEFTTESILPTTKRLKPVYTPIEGEIFVQNLTIQKFQNKYGNKLIGKNSSLVSVGNGKIFLLPKEAKLNTIKTLNQNHGLFSLKIVTPFPGIISFTNSYFFLISNKQKYILNFESLKSQIKGVHKKFNFFFKNYQYLDSYSLLINILYYSNQNYSLKKIKFKNYIQENTKINQKNYFYKKFYILIITNKHLHNIYIDTKESLKFIKKIYKKDLKKDNLQIFPLKTQILPNLFSYQSGILLKQIGMKFSFQNIFSFFLNDKVLLYHKPNSVIMSKTLIASLINNIQQTTDIVQGLPKIEEIIEARIPERKALLNKNSTIFFGYYYYKQNEIYDKVIIRYYKNAISLIFGKKDINHLNFYKNLEKQTEENQEKFFYLLNFHNLKIKNNFIFFNEAIYKTKQLPLIYFSLLKKFSKKKDFINIWKEISLTSNNSFNINKSLKNQNYSKIKKIFKLQDKKKNQLLLLTKKNNILQLNKVLPFSFRKISYNTKLNLKIGTYLDIATPITEGFIDIHSILDILYEYHLLFDNTLESVSKTLNKCQLLLVNAIQAIYYSQGVNISSKHIEIIIKQMTSKIVIEHSGDSPLLPDEIINFSLMKEIYNSLKNTKSKYKLPFFKPVIKSVTTISLNKEGILTSASFQETKKVLTKAAIEGVNDWLRGLKESIIIGKLIPAGSAFLNYKNYLDNIYFFQK